MKALKRESCPIGQQNLAQCFREVPGNQVREKKVKCRKINDFFPPVYLWLCELMPLGNWVLMSLSQRW